MARQRRTTEEEWYDIFSGWDTADQAVAIRVLEQVHRIARRGAKKADTEAVSLSGLPDEDQA